MIIVMKATAGARDVAAVAERMRGLGFTPEVGEAAERVIVSVAGGGAAPEAELFSAM